MFKKEDLCKQIKVAAVHRGYYGNQIKHEGSVFYVKRHEFSPNWMVHVDEKNKAYSEQPNKLSTKLVKEALGLDKKKESKPEFPLLTEEALNDSQEAGLQSAQTVHAQDLVDEPAPVVEPTVDDGAAAHV